MAFKLIIFVSAFGLLDAASLPIFYHHPWVVPASAFDLQLPVHPNHPINIQYPISIPEPLNVQQPLQPLNIQPLNIQPINIPEPIRPLQVQIPKISFPNSGWVQSKHFPGQTILVQNSPGYQTAISSEIDGVILRSALTSTSNSSGYLAALSLTKTSGKNGNYETSASANLNSGTTDLSVETSTLDDDKFEHRSVVSNTSTPEQKLD